LLHRFAFGIAPSMTRAPDRNRGRRHSDIASSSDALTYTSRNDMRSPVTSQYKSYVFHPRRTRGALGWLFARKKRKCSPDMAGVDRQTGAGRRARRGKRRNWAEWQM
jgi:hypothetical protein